MRDRIKAFPVPGSPPPSQEKKRAPGLGPRKPDAQPPLGASTVEGQPGDEPTLWSCTPILKPRALRTMTLRVALRATFLGFGCNSG